MVAVAFSNLAVPVPTYTPSSPPPPPSPCRSPPHWYLLRIIKQWRSAKEVLFQPGLLHELSLADLPENLVRKMQTTMEAYGENKMDAGKAQSVANNAMGGCKLAKEVANTRRALRDINNYMGAGPLPRAVTKRCLPEKKPCNENSLKQISGHRPITRGYAASIANKQARTEESTSRSDGSVDLIQTMAVEQTLTNLDKLVVDVDEYTMVSDSPLSAHAKQMEDLLDEENAMDEVEMADACLDTPDIDSHDKKDPLAVVDYVEDIYSYYRRVEPSSCVNPDYMSHQFDINERMRAILIDWLIEVHYKFDLLDETLFLMVNLIDRFLERHPVVRKKLQLVGVTAMLLACKYEEVTVPVVEDLILISDRAYSRQEVLAMEKLMVSTLQFNMTVPTPYVFIRRFLKTVETDKKLQLLSLFMMELCLVEYEMLNYPPSLLAASAVYTAQCTLSRFRIWSKTSEWHTKYSEDQLIECSKLMVEFHKKAANGKLTGVHRKYSTSKFGYAAKAVPAHFLLGV